ncbi:MAG: hypothetical protein ACLGIR_00485 [Actinomycetes bacterium]
MAIATERLQLPIGLNDDGSVSHYSTTVDPTPVTAHYFAGDVVVADAVAFVDVAAGALVGLDPNGYRKDLLMMAEEEETDCKFFEEKGANQGEHLVRYHGTPPGVPNETYNASNGAGSLNFNLSYVAKTASEGNRHAGTPYAILTCIEGRSTPAPRTTFTKYRLKSTEVSLGFQGPGGNKAPVKQPTLAKFRRDQAISLQKGFSVGAEGATFGGEFGLSIGGLEGIWDGGQGTRDRFKPYTINTSTVNPQNAAFAYWFDVDSPGYCEGIAESRDIGLLQEFVFYPWRGGVDEGQFWFHDWAPGHDIAQYRAFFC